MKRAGLLVWLATLALSLSIIPALATDGQLQLKEKPKFSRTATTATDIKPLQKPIRLSPAMQMQMRAKTPRLNLPVHWQQLEQQFNELSGKAQEYEMGVATIPDIQKQCAEKSYSVQDQQAAGCNGNETLNQCMEKLVHHCVESYSSGGMSWGGMNVGGVEVGSGGEIPSVSTQSFREAAKQTAAKARAMSQKLQQYASQAERNAAAWK